MTLLPLQAAFREWCEGKFRAEVRLQDVRERSVLRLQAAVRGWLRGRRAQTTGLSYKDKRSGKHKRKKKQVSDNELLDHCMARAEAERQQLLEKASKLVE